MTRDVASSIMVISAALPSRTLGVSDDLAAAWLPQLGFGHQPPHGLAAHREAVALRQLLGGQGRPKVALLGIAQGGHHLSHHRVVELAIGRPAAGLINEASKLRRLSLGDDG